MPDRHADHDVALVAASISDDLTSAERATVTDLLAACGECRELAADLRALAAATAALPVPPRRRDYRLTADQAARLRPSGVRGLVAALGSRRFSFAAPLGTAMATLGIVGLLVAAIPGPLAGGAAQVPMPELMNAAGEDAPVLTLPGPGAMGAASPAPAVDAEAPAAKRLAPTEGPDVASEQDDLIARASPPEQLLRTVLAEISDPRGTDEVLVILGGAALLVGIVLVALRWTGRQLA